VLENLEAKTVSRFLFYKGGTLRGFNLRRVCFKPKEIFRDGSKIPEIAKLSEEIEKTLIEQFPGYRIDPDKPFTFRIFTEAEFRKSVVPFGYKTVIK
jgi:hypothetical protein